MRYRKAFVTLNLPPRRYILTIALPVVAGGMLLAAAIAQAGRAFLPGLLVAALAPFVVLFAVAVAAVYPIAEVDRRKRQIDDALPFFMTHFGVLSTSNLPRVDILRTLAAKKEYKALSGELERLVGLVTTWNLAMPDAARQVSELTPSRIFSDFLERLAYAMETGQDLESFLRAEQTVVLREYASMYENSLYRIEGWKDIYMSAVMSGAFFVIFAALLPMLVGGDVVGLLIGALAFILFVESLLLMLLRGRLPADRLIHKLKIQTPESRRHERLLRFAVPLSALILLGAWAAGTGLQWAVLGATLPLAGVGIWSQVEEGRIKRREENYPAFIRSLGSAAQARGGNLTDVLAHVRSHNFGPLSGIVERLHARLTWHIDDARSWRHYAAESGSNLIDAFNGMFVEGASAGGKPGAIGEMISQNVVRILGLRTGRYSAADTFRGLVFSLTAAMSFVMFVGVSVVGAINGLFQEAFDASTAAQIPVRIGLGVDMGAAKEVITTILFVHALISGFLIKMVDGGRFTGGLLYFSGMLWLAVLIGLGTESLAPGIVSL